MTAASGELVVGGPVSDDLVASRRRVREAGARVVGYGGLDMAERARLARSRSRTRSDATETVVAGGIQAKHQLRPAGRRAAGG